MSTAAEKGQTSRDKWVALWKTCDCIAAVVVDEPTHQRDTANDVADFMRRGLRVYRYNADQFAATPWRCEQHPEGTPYPWDLEKRKRATAETTGMGL